MGSGYIYRLGSHYAIEGSIDLVWRYVSDFRTYPQWNPGVRTAEVAHSADGSGAIQVGSVIRVCQRCLLPYDVLSESVVTSVQPPYLLEMDTHATGRGATNWYGVTRIRLAQRGALVEVEETNDFPAERAEPAVPAIFRPLVARMAAFNHEVCARRHARALQRVVRGAPRTR
jgi:hypothetical protein